MTKWHNQTGKPLSSLDWLKIHHKAKLMERETFAKNILNQIKPKRIIDLGCASGLWLDVFNRFADKDCEFIGIDIDNDSIIEAEKLSKNWNRKVSFLNIDIASQSSKIPSGDIILAFNMFSYINDIDTFLNQIKLKLTKNGVFVIRQYDGGMIRFGPMSSDNRNYMDDSLYTAVSDSEQFKHYDMDRVYTAITNSKFVNKNLYFEIFQKHSPFAEDFNNYFKATVKWTANYLNSEETKELNKWYTKFDNQPGYYFLENYLVSLLSCASTENSQRSV
jgi:SAM-dependent methyltransferase